MEEDQWRKEDPVLPENEPNGEGRYEVQFQTSGRGHSLTQSLDEAKFSARCLAKWNYSAQVVDKADQSIVFKVSAYSEASPSGDDRISMTNV